MIEESKLNLIYIHPQLNNQYPILKELILLGYININYHINI
jgi:hypothetical protein